MEANEKNPHESGPDTLPKAEWPAYVQGCIVKQCGVTPEVAARRVAELKPEQVAELRELGRLGKVSELRDYLMGLAARPADPPETDPPKDPPEAE